MSADVDGPGVWRWPAGRPLCDPAAPIPRETCSCASNPAVCRLRIITTPILDFCCLCYGSTFAALCYIKFALCLRSSLYEYCSALVNRPIFPRSPFFRIRSSLPQVSYIATDKDFYRPDALSDNKITLKAKCQDNQKMSMNEWINQSINQCFYFRN